MAQKASGGTTGYAKSAAPAIALPKGGGAIRGIGEKFAANPVTGTGSLSVPIFTSPGRSGFGPQLSLSYDSGAGNGPFGFGWSLSLPSITRKTDRGLPRYWDAEESDVFILSGAEDLVPVLVKAGGRWQRKKPDLRRIDGVQYRVERYRPRAEGLFARIERWTDIQTGDTHWRSISRDNVTTLYGDSPESRIADPANPARVFSWLICESHDDKGNAVVYEYVPENSTGIELSQAHESNRSDNTRSANRYLKRIKYGNRASWLLQQPGASLPDPPWPDLSGMDWLFEVVFDYGEGHCTPLPLDPEGRRHARVVRDPPPAWPVRADPFSSHRAGFEVRTYRLCRRVLMFHHFPAELGTDDYLVRSTEFTYREDPVASFITEITQFGYVHEGGGTYLQRSLPPLELQYSRVPSPQELAAQPVHNVDAESVENLPYGLDGGRYQWVDLDGEGLSGILTEQAEAWFYKPNKGGGRFGPVEPVAARPSLAALSSGRQQLLDLAGDGQLDLAEFAGPVPGFFERTVDQRWEQFTPFASLPQVAWDDPNLRFVDLTGDGHADVLITEGEVFTWCASLAEEGFGPRVDLPTSRDEERGPRLVFADGAQSVYLADMSGDGLTDLVRIRNGEVCYWPNLGYGRFGPKVSMDNPPWFDAPDLFEQRRIRLADIDGSGVTDIVYLGNGQVHVYLNQSGNGWSEAHTLTRFPRTDNLSSVTVADLFGAGTACLVWSSALPGEARRPMRYLDLMGGTKPHLLVSVNNNLGAETHIEYAPSTRFYLADKAEGRPWATKLPFPVQVVERVETLDLVSRNRFVTRYAYHHGYFDGIEREFRGFAMVEQSDTEQHAALSESDALPAATNIDAASHVPPVRTRTWFHTGAYLEGEAISRQLEHEYWHESDAGQGLAGLAPEQLRAMLLDDTILPTTVRRGQGHRDDHELSAEEAREAARALKGSILRQEVYTLDDSEEQDRPYTVSERNYTLELLQPRDANPHAVFLAHPRETLDFHYERTLYDIGGHRHFDPRVTHALTLEVDDYGNALESASVSYKRRFADPDPLLTEQDRRRQQQTLLTCTVSSYTYPIDDPDAWRAPLPCESRTYELLGLEPEPQPPPPAGITRLFRFDELARKLERAAVTELPYEHWDASVNAPARRLIEHARTLYRSNDLTALLAPRELQSRAVPGESYSLAFTPALLDQVYRRGQQSLLPDRANVLGAKASDGGGYVDLDGDGRWWIPSGRVFYSPAADELRFAREHFFLLHRFSDPFGNDTVVGYDDHKLLTTRTTDPVGNTVRADHDYRVLQPWRVTDANGNRSEAAFDALGLLAGTAVRGKPTENRGDSLTGFQADLTRHQVDGFFDAIDPHVPARDLLGEATARIVYDLDRFRLSREADQSEPERWMPAFAATLARETHASQLADGQQTKIQITFSYSDGLGREIQKKIQAEPGPLVDGGPDVDRWVGSGWIIFNNKGKPVRQYEPFFSTLAERRHRFEFARKEGVSTILCYDPLERVVATLHPNHSYEKVVIDPWRQAAYDVNDTVTLDPRADPEAGRFLSRLPADEYLPTWYQQRITGTKGTEERRAAEKAAKHADTPTRVFLDTLGRTFLTVADNAAAGTYRTRVRLDIEGNQREIIDARDRIVMRYDYDLLGDRIHQASMEAGERWTLNDATGQPIRVWNGRGHAFRNAYDPSRRPLRSFVHGGDPTDPSGEVFAEEVLFERIIYGEQHSQAETLNLRGKPFLQFDGAGVITNGGQNRETNQPEAYDFKGNLLHSSRRLARDYTQAPGWSGVEASLSDDPLTLLDLPSIESAVAPLLDGETYVTSTTFDALNRPITVTTPDRSVILSGYNEANLPQRIEARLGGAEEPTRFVTDIGYNAKGQRTYIVYGNRVRTTYDYDEETFRLTRLFTQRDAAAFPGDCPQPPPGGWPGCGVQDLRYTYDPAGHITHIRDHAQQAIFFRNRRVEPSNEYAYDAIYRLVEATGREHLGQNAAGAPLPPSPTSYNDCPRVGLAHPGDGKAMGLYRESYTYDEVGNFQAVTHRGSDPANPGWTRAYRYEENSPLEPGHNSNRLTATTTGHTTETYSTAGDGYDSHGNMLRLPQLQVLRWDFQDQLRLTQRRRVNDQDEDGAQCHGERTWYVYDAAGQRVRKVTELATGAIKDERIYLGAFEVRRRQGINPVVRETLHIMDDEQRIALVETRTADDDGSPKQLIRYQLANHLGSASLELNQQAQIITYEEYHPYGCITYQAVDKAIRAAVKRYRYAGKERDEESGLCYHGARYYAPWLGRWITCDPLSIAGDVNSFASTDKNPMRLIDNRRTRSRKPEALLRDIYGKEVAAQAPIHSPITGRFLQRNAADPGIRPNAYLYAHNNPCMWVDPLGSQEEPAQHWEQALTEARKWGHTLLQRERAIDRLRHKAIGEAAGYIAEKVVMPIAIRTLAVLHKKYFERMKDYDYVSLSFGGTAAAGGGWTAGQTFLMTRGGKVGVYEFGPHGWAPNILVFPLSISGFVQYGIGKGLGEDLRKYLGWFYGLAANAKVLTLPGIESSKIRLEPGEEPVMEITGGFSAGLVLPRSSRGLSVSAGRAFYEMQYGMQLDFERRRFQMLYLGDVKLPPLLRELSETGGAW
ncbi:MAG: SpvB/TcaC N-terminal domain-containing protein [Micromonosporaceae bacterium]